MNKIFRNSLFNISRVIIITPIFFLLIPYIITKIGIEGYGLWALIGIISSYHMFVNFGLTAALIRYVAKENAAKNYEKVNEYLATSIVVFLVSSPFIFLLIVIFRKFIVVNIMGIKENVDIAIFLILIAGLSSIVNMISGLFKSIIDGLQKMDVSNMIITVQVIVSAIVTFILLENGYGLKGLGVNLLIVSILTLLANVFSAKKLLPSLKINPLLFQFTRLKEIFGYSIRLHLSSIIRIGIVTISKILISHFFSIVYVGYYEIAYKFMNAITVFIRSSITPIFPASADIQHKYGYRKVEVLREKASKYMFAGVTIFYITAFVLISNFVKLWLSYDLQIVSFIVQIFLVGSYISILATPAYIILNGLGFAKDTLIVQVQTCVVNIVGILFFSLLFGFYGFCIGFSISMIYSFFATHYFYNRRLGKEIRVHNLFNDKRLVFCATVFLAIEFIFVDLFAIDSYLKIIIFGSCFFSIYLVTIWMLKVFDRNDIEELLGNKLSNRIFRKESVT